jgi:hypothetical protein
MTDNKRLPDDFPTATGGNIAFAKGLYYKNHKFDENLLLFGRYFRKSYLFEGSLVIFVLAKPPLYRRKYKFFRTSLPG